MKDFDEVNLAKTGRKEGKRFDYKGMHRYLITLPVYGSRSVFVDRDNVRSVLDALRESCLHHHFDGYAYCFLPDSLVLVVRGKTDNADMKAFLSDFRSTSDAAIRTKTGNPLWKKKYMERVLRKTEETRDIAEDVFRLPVKAGLASKPDGYPHTGSFVIRRR